MTPETERRMAFRGIALVLLAMLLFAVMDGVNKHLAKTYSFVQILWVRYLLLVVVAALASRGIGIRRALASRQRGIQIARSLVLVAEQATFVIAFIHLPLADVHALAAVSPLIVTLLSAPILRERVSLYRMLAVASGFAGVLLILRPGTGAMSAEAAIPLLAALLWAVYQMLTRLASRTDPPETSLLYAGLAGACVLSLAGPFYWLPPAPGDWGLLGLVAALSATAHFSLIKALRYAEASALQPFGYSLFLWAVVVGFIGFGDFPDAWTLAGAAVILASNLYAVRRTRAEGESGPGPA